MLLNLTQNISISPGLFLSLLGSLVCLGCVLVTELLCFQCSYCCWVISLRLPPGCYALQSLGFPFATKWSHFLSASGMEQSLREAPLQPHTYLWTVTGRGRSFARILSLPRISLPVSFCYLLLQKGFHFLLLNTPILMFIPLAMDL